MKEYADTTNLNFNGGIVLCIALLCSHAAVFQIGVSGVANDAAKVQ